MLDADGSTDPAEIPRFVDALTQGADFAKGSRFMPGAGSSDISRLRQYGQLLAQQDRQPALRDPLHRPLLRLQRVPSGLPLESSTSTRVSPTTPQPTTMLWGDGFEVETLINVRIAKAGLRVSEVPSFESSRFTARATSTPSPMACGCSARSRPSAGGGTGPS